MFVYPVHEHIDHCRWLAPVSAWAHRGGRQAAEWATNALLVAMSTPSITEDLKGGLREEPSVGVLPTPGSATPYLLLKLNDNGQAYIITEAAAEFVPNTGGRPIEVILPWTVLRHVDQS